MHRSAKDFLEAQTSEQKYQARLYGGGTTDKPDFSIARIDDVKGIDAVLLRELCMTGVEAFDRKTMTYQEVEEHVLKSHTLFYVRNKEGRIVGFAGMQGSMDSEQRSIYLSGAALLEEAQGNGLYAQLSLARIRVGLEAGATLVHTSTQNPKVEAGIRDALDSLAAEGRIAGHTIKREHLKSYYGRMLTSEIPKSRHSEINAEYGKLDYGAGDAYKLSFELQM